MWFYGPREHLIFTSQGLIAQVLQLPGNRHDVNGLYALLNTSFQGTLLGDSAYWPNKKKRAQLAQQGIVIHAEKHKNWIHCEETWPNQRRTRDQVERRIALFNAQFHANRTLNRSRRHYSARRWTKALAHNCSRSLNQELHYSLESMSHFHAVA